MTRPRWRKPLLILGGIVLFLVVAIVVAILLVPPNRIKDEALVRARRATGYAMEAGPARFRIRVSGIGVRVEDLLVAAPDSSQVFTTRAVDVWVRLLPLFSRRVEIRALEIHEPSYVLRTTGTPSGRPSSGPSPVMGFVAVESWRIENGSYLQVTPQGTLTLEGCTLEGGLRLDPRGGGEAHAAGTIASGTWQGGALRVPLPSLDVALDGRVSPALDTLRFPDIRVQAGDLAAHLTGLVTRSGEGMDWAFTGNAPAASFSALAAFLSPEQRARMEALSVSGNVALPELRLSGTTRTAGGRPIPAAVSGRAELKDLSAQAPGGGARLTEGRAGVAFTRTQILIDGRGIVAGAPLTVTGAVDVPAKRLTSLRIAGDVDAALLAGFLPPGGLSLERGRFRIDVDLSGNLPFDRTHLPQARGTVRMEDLAGRARTTEFEGVSGTFTLAGDRGRLEKLVGFVEKLPVSNGSARVVPQEGAISLEDIRATVSDGALVGQLRFAPGD